MTETIDNVIFDFDGVIADSQSVFIDTLEEVLHRPEPFTEQYISELRGLSTKQVVKRLGVKKFELPRLMINGKRVMAERMDEVDIFDGMYESMAEIHESKRKLFIVSTNSEDSVRSILNRYQLEGLFTNIYADTGIFGKARRISSLIRKEGLIKESCVYVGDETRDIEAARKVGIKCLAVTWGYNTPESLKAYQPDFIVDSPANILEVISS